MNRSEHEQSKRENVSTPSGLVRSWAKPTESEDGMQYLVTVMFVIIMTVSALTVALGIKAGRWITDTRISGSLGGLILLGSLAAIMLMLFYCPVHESDKWRMQLFLPLIPFGFGLGLLFGWTETRSKELSVWYSWKETEGFRDLSTDERREYCLQVIPVAILEIAWKLRAMTKHSPSVRVETLNARGLVVVWSKDHRILRRLPKRVLSEDLEVFERTGLIDGQAQMVYIEAEEAI